ncbi:MAG: helix-turn-helix transcriptional regulator [Candidatus Aenigmarchaeota archaeon]|nr:helix-turn-helix transcriptional regulator [Candidatus Aenigmarchaeota archaeon]
MQRPSERLKRKIEKENLWLFILSLLLKRRSYAYEVRDAIKERFGFWIGTVTAYKVLYLLEQGGYVTSTTEGRKTYYQITQQGKDEVRIARSFLRTMLKH